MYWFSLNVPKNAKNMQLTKCQKFFGLSELLSGEPPRSPWERVNKFADWFSRITPDSTCRTASHLNSMPLSCPERTSAFDTA
ncbi:unnamed protein product [Hermetia illucens]|uniref:Uncharacterized protein n=1 Tax=Hermetia illucens TaxID=343691 RepID=A0A7R8V1B2_HERIL|nr:unnamed protein product [Hermetia illucens]